MLVVIPFWTLFGCYFVTSVAVPARFPLALRRAPMGVIGAGMPSRTLCFVKDSP